MFSLTQERCARIIRPCGLSMLLLAIVIVIPFAGTRPAHADDCDFNEMQLPIIKEYWKTNRHMGGARTGSAAAQELLDALAAQECVTIDEADELSDLISDALGDASAVVEAAEMGLAMIEELPEECQEKLPDWIARAITRFTLRLEHGTDLLAELDDLTDQAFDLTICPREDE